MTLLQMSFTGGILILAIIVLRALALNRLPKSTFLVLWAVAVLRLLVPFSIPSPASVYTLAEHTPVQTVMPAPPTTSFVPNTAPTAQEIPKTVPVPEDKPSVDIWPIVWAAGTALCGAYFLISYFRCRKEFQTALPVKDARLQTWLANQRLRRKVTLRQSGQIRTPLTYGLLRPVILLPKKWEQEPQLDYVLEHELTHIRHLDALWKPILTLTACVHWFNPLVWCMFVLANRDMELRCDEVVIRRLGLDRRSSYALALISLEEKKSGLGPFASAFSKNAIEERIGAIMKTKKRSLAAIVMAAVLVGCIATGFATSAAKKNAVPTVVPYPKARDGIFTQAELDRLSELWFEGCEDMTIADYQQKMRTEFDTPEYIDLIDRYSHNSVGGVSIYNFKAPETILPERAFCDYFNYVFQVLMWDYGQSDVRFMFPGAAGIMTEDGDLIFLKYLCTLHVLSRETLTVGEYQQTIAAVNEGAKALLGTDPTEEDYAELSQRLSTDALAVTVTEDISGRPNAADLYAQFANDIAAEWDRLLSPYVPFGLTYEFDDPDHDGNGLTMWYNGKEVRSIYDPQAGIWIAEHVGTGFSEGAIDLYTVYTNGTLSGLREASPEEQAQFDEIHENNHSESDFNISLNGNIPIYAVDTPNPKEIRNYPRATPSDLDVSRNDSIPIYAINVPDADLYAQSSSETAAEWDRVLSPYVPFGLTYQFDDPDHDGNGLTMWYNGKEVRSIYDQLEGIWIAEHTGNSFSDGAVDLYTVRTYGELTGLREASPEEQDLSDKLYEGNGIYVESFRSIEEAREYPRATLEDYDSLLMMVQMYHLYLDDQTNRVSPSANTQYENLWTFNNILQKWVNENPDAWNRINCDVIWNDFDEELTTEAKTFAFTCYLSGMENGLENRYHYSGTQEDPSLSASLPMRSNKENGVVTAWCDLYYSISYHANKSLVSPLRRDASVNGMLADINAFWQETDLDTLLQMTEEDVTALFNKFAEENSTSNDLIINVNRIRFEAHDERNIRN